MKIFIDNVIEDGINKGELYLESDPMQYILVLYNGKKGDKGQDLYVNKGYYATINQALNAVLKMKIHASTATTVHELLQEAKDTQAWLDAKIAL